MIYKDKTCPVRNPEGSQGESISNRIETFFTKDWVDYNLLDTGEGEKLERVGSYTFVRPFEDAVWPKTLSKKEWSEVDGKFWSSRGGSKAGWKMNKEIEKKFDMSYKGIKFLATPTPFRHFGFFAEQASHWDFIEEKISKLILKKNFLETAPSETKGQGTHTFLENSFSKSNKKPVKFLNLFGYTGVASLFALRAGAEVTHLDASKQSLDWAKENQKINANLEKLPMRIICDDVLKFLDREIKRGNKYDAVIMDPPKFGRGPKGETWKIEEKLPDLLSKVEKVLSEKPLFVILTSYAVETSSLSLGYALEETMKKHEGSMKNGEMCVVEKSNGRLISLANTAIWEGN